VIVKYALVAVDRKTGQAHTVETHTDFGEAQKRLGSHSAWYRDSRYALVQYEEVELSTPKVPSTGRYQPMLRESIVQCTDCSTRYNAFTLREEDIPLHERTSHDPDDVPFATPEEGVAYIKNLARGWVKE
jgi:hypothetical protein